MFRTCRDGGLEKRDRLSGFPGGGGGGGEVLSRVSGTDPQILQSKGDGPGFLHG